MLLKTAIAVFANGYSSNYSHRSDRIGNGLYRLAAMANKPQPAPRSTNHIYEALIETITRIVRTEGIPIVMPRQFLLYHRNLAAHSGVPIRQHR